VISDEEPVLWGRFESTISSMTGRIEGLERHNEDQFSRIRENERALSTSIQDRRELARRVDRLVTDDEGKRQRTWNLATILLTSVALPILVSVVLVWLHIGANH
jgi:hypothetical protein